MVELPLIRRPERADRPRSDRRAFRTLSAAAVAITLSGGLLLPAPASAHAANSPVGGAKRDAAGKTYDITLVTGHVAHFTDGPGRRDNVTVDSPDGVPDGGIRIQQAGDSVYAIPDEAVSLLAAGRLDRRLFDVKSLAEMGYDDRRTGGVPLIAGYSAKAARSAPAPEGASVVRRLESVHATALRAKKNDARTFWRGIAPSAKAKTLSGGIDKLWLDGRVTAALKDSVPQIGAPEAWAKGYDGKGVKVAVLDTGIDVNHPDVKDRIAGTNSFVTGETIADRNGHGTHVASTIAGSGAQSEGANKGVAPGAELLVGKVLSDAGEGQDSWIIDGMEWAKAQGADVVSMSLGSQQSDSGSGPMSQAVNQLSANGGPLFVIAAGNSYGAGTIGSPGSAAAALTVAAVDKSDGRADFSSMGPLPGSYGLKPDISAPGVGINAARSQEVPGAEGWYQSMDGTSMATPHVAGAAALLKQRHPDWSGDRVKDALMSTSKRLTAYTPYEMGTGRVDVPAALDTAIEATGSVETARYDWPHEASDTPAERKITYRNTGDRPVTLNLATDTDQAAYSLSASTLTVPAGGTAEAVLGLDPSKVPADTTFSGQVVATDADTGETVAHTGFALAKERELWDLTIRLRDRAGKPAKGYVVVGEKNDEYLFPYEVDGERTLRLPPGTYTSWTSLDVEGDRPDSLGTAQLMEPETLLNKDATVTLDASKARRASARVPQETEERQVHVDFARTSDNGRVIRDGYVVPLKYDSVWVSPTKKVTQGNFSYVTRWRLGEKSVDVEARGRDIAARQQLGSVVADGKDRLRAVYAGKGATADYKKVDARGRAVIIDRSDEVPPAERLAAAKAAGAKALFVANDTDGRLLESYQDESGASAGIMVVSLMREEGRRLAAEAKRSSLTLDIERRAHPRYVYDLVSRHDGTVPDRSLAYTPDVKRDLAKVDTTFYGHRKVSGGGFRHYVPEWGPSFGLEERESYPSERTDYVTPTSGGAFWYESHSVLDATDDRVLEQRGGMDRPKAGRTYAAKWFALIQRPRLGTGFWGPFRQQYDTMQFNIPMWTDAAEGHAGSMPRDEYDTGKIALYQGDKLLKETDGRSSWVGDLPKEKLPYRLVLTGSRDADLWKSSIRTRTEWGFVSEALPEDGPFQEDLRLLQLDYDVDVDTAGDVRAGSRTEITLASGTQEWLEGGRRPADKATLSVSFDDGRTWKPVSLRGTGAGQWKATVQTPHKKGGSVSLKATAADGKGLTVSQEIIRAFGLN
ncbi:S8 family serine peptidase [Streptomyces pathocidini]|uniref:S8 family serine peptidase n=1 Tax=Streptomyces pathocidini TaxID=1650571 RepID=UPI0034018E93